MLSSAGERGGDQRGAVVGGVVEAAEDRGAEAVADQQRRDAGQRDPAVGQGPAPPEAISDDGSRQQG